MISNIKLVIIKQWPLSGEFVQFEYSPKIRRFWRVRVLAKRAFFGNMQDSPDSPPFAKPFTEDSPDSPTFAKPFTEYSTDSPTFAKPFTEDSPDSLKVSLASITRVWRIWRMKGRPFYTYKMCFWCIK
jgi:hypothetical protein